MDIRVKESARLTVARGRGGPVGRAQALWCSLMAVMVAGVAFPASADIRYYAFDAGDRLTQSLTRGITLEIDRGLMGATRLRSLYSTSSRGQARFTAGGPSAVLSALPDTARENQIYGIADEGDGRALGNALCPGSDNAWVVGSRIRSGHPTTLHAVGVWSDGAYRLCATLNYRYRGEWATPGAAPTAPEGLNTPL